MVHMLNLSSVETLYFLRLFFSSMTMITLISAKGFVNKNCPFVQCLCTNMLRSRHLLNSSSFSINLVFISPSIFTVRKNETIDYLMELK